jgi:hypothetical protein
MKVLRNALVMTLIGLGSMGCGDRAALERAEAARRAAEERASAAEKALAERALRQPADKELEGSRFPTTPQAAPPAADREPMPPAADVEEKAAEVVLQKGQKVAPTLEELLSAAPRVRGALEGISREAPNTVQQDRINTLLKELVDRDVSLETRIVGVGARPKGGDRFELKILCDKSKVRITKDLRMPVTVGTHGEALIRFLLFQNAPGNAADAAF